MLTLVQGGDVCAPEHLGHQDLLLSGGAVVRIGTVDRRALEAAGFEVGSHRRFRLLGYTRID